MSKKYTYSRGILTGEGEEVFTAVEFDSFDEARKAVDKGVSDRKLELSPKVTPAVPNPAKKIIEDDLPPSEGTHQPEENKN